MINVAELLKDAPYGTELWCTLFGKVTLESVDTTEIYPITIKIDSHKEKLDAYGRFYTDFEEAECVLFPSKDCHTWERWKAPIKHNFEVGDWIINKFRDICLITNIDLENGYYICESNRFGNIDGDIDLTDKAFHLWTIQDAVDGDILSFGNETIVMFKDMPNIISFHSHCHLEDGIFDISTDNKHDWWEADGFKPATKEQRDLLFAKILEAGYRWDEKNKVLHKIKHYDIANFKTKQWVLVRDDDEWEWALTRFSHLSNGSASLFVCINGASFQQCIPFERNEKLLGTSNPCPGEFVNW